MYTNTATHGTNALDAVKHGLAVAGLTVNKDRVATMVERITTMLESVGMFRSRIFRRCGIDAPTDPVMIATAVAQMVAEVRHGDVDLSGAHVSLGVILPGDIDCPNCIGMGLVREESIGIGRIFSTCDCTDLSATDNEHDGWEMPPWQVAALGHRATMVTLDEACASTQRRPDAVAVE